MYTLLLKVAKIQNGTMDMSSESQVGCEVKLSYPDSTVYSYMYVEPTYKYIDNFHRE